MGEKFNSIQNSVPINIDISKSDRIRHLKFSIFQIFSNLSLDSFKWLRIYGFPVKKKGECWGMDGDETDMKMVC